jgi:hypothetical protein
MRQHRTRLYRLALPVTVPLTAALLAAGSVEACSGLIGFTT